MKKTFLFMLPCIAAVATATFVGTKSFKSNVSESNDLLLANVEALSQSTDWGPNECPVQTWVRDAREGYYILPISGSLGAGFYCYINGHKVSLGLEAKGHASVKFYDCIDKKRNCCKKTWIEKPHEYL